MRDTPEGIVAGMHDDELAAYREAGHRFYGDVPEDFDCHHPGCHRLAAHRPPYGPHKCLTHVDDPYNLERLTAETRQRRAVLIAELEPVEADLLPDAANMLTRLRAEATEEP